MNAILSNNILQPRFVYFTSPVSNELRIFAQDLDVIWDTTLTNWNIQYTVRL